MSTKPSLPGFRFLNGLITVAWYLLLILLLLHIPLMMISMIQPDLLFTYSQTQQPNNRFNAGLQITYRKLFLLTSDLSDRNRDETVEKQSSVTRPEEYSTDTALVKPPENHQISVGLYAGIIGIMQATTGHDQSVDESQMDFEGQKQFFPGQRMMEKRWIQFFSGIISSLFFLILFCIVHSFRIIFRHLSQNEFFHPDNIRAMRRISFTVIFGYPTFQIIRFMLSMVGELKLFPMLYRTYASDLTIELMPFAVGLVLLILAEIFRFGAALEQDQQLTI